MVVVHRADTDNLQAAYEKMRRVTLTSTETTERSGGAPEVNVSTHYLVDRDGSIYSLMKDFHIARHIDGLEPHAIGITNVAATERALTDAQITANALLIRHLKGQYGTITWLIGASEFLRPL